MDLFEASMAEACEALSYECPNDRPKIDAYLETLSLIHICDLASIGMAETIHAATRGENITVIFINNAIYRCV